MVHDDAKQKNYSQLKSRAVNLRRLGFSYREIKKEINVAKSTLSLWLKSVALSSEHKQRLYTKQVAILSRGAQSQKERRGKEIAEIIEKAKKEIKLPLSDEVYRFFGAALYWAEGSKTQGFEITNSDPHLILFMVRWAQKVLGINSQKLKAWLNIYPQQNEKLIKQFWAQLTGIPIENFGKSFVKPLSSGYKKNNLYYGTIKVNIPKGTDTRHRVFGWVKTILQEISPEVELVQKRWVSLTEKSRPVNLLPDAPIT